MSIRGGGARLWNKSRGCPRVVGAERGSKGGRGGLNQPSHCLPAFPRNSSPEYAFHVPGDVLFHQINPAFLRQSVVEESHEST